MDDAGPVESGQLSDSIVSLADMLARDLHFEWYEALAIALQLCRGITLSSEQTGSATVQLDNVFIAPVGDVVALTRPQHPASVVPRVAELFNEILPDFHRRTTFRAVIDQATSDPPGYASLEELAEALTPFERPHRLEIVRGVYQRWRVIAATALPPESDALDIFLSEGPSANPIAPEPILTSSELPSLTPQLPILTPDEDWNLAQIPSENLTANSTASLLADSPAAVAPSPPPILTTSPARAQSLSTSVAPVLSSSATPALAPAAPANLTSYTPSFTAPIKPRARRQFWRAQSVFLLQASALAAVVVMLLGLSIWALGLRRPPVAVSSSPVSKQTDPIPDRQEAAEPPAAPAPERAPATAAARRELPGATRRPATPAMTAMTAEAPRLPPPPIPPAPREVAIPSTPALSVRASTTSTDKPIASGQPVQPLRATQPAAPRRSPPETTPLAASAASEPVIEPSRPAPADRPSNSVSSPLVPAALARPDNFDIATTFSEADAGVVPPVPDSSQQLWLMPASPRRSDQIKIEVVVDERGSVRSVRAVERADSLADAAALTMSLSAVKSWHFTPALKDGRPVKYRLSLTLTIH